MEEVLSKPVELTESDLDLVAGGNPFSYSYNSGSFAIGPVSDDFSNFSFSANVGEMNTFGDNHA